MTEETLAPAAAEPITVTDDAGSPTPPEPQPQEAAEAPKAPSRREAFERAFKALDDRDTGQKSPPEDSASDDGRPRGPDGKFIAKNEGEVALKQPAKPEDVKTEADKAPVSEAPSRFSADAKAAWKDAPEAVRGEINRAISELESGLRMKDEQLAPLKPFFDMAQQHGVTVHGALGNYIRMEQALAKDLPTGMKLLAQNFGMTLEDFLAAVGGQAASAAPESEKDREILALNQKISQLQQQIGGVQETFQTQQHNTIMGQVEQFAAQNPRFDELSGEIVKLLQTGYASDLKTAYEIADRLNPAPQPEPPATPAPKPQQRQALSVTGAPNAGSNPGNRQPSASRTEALQRAFSASGLT